MIALLLAGLALAQDAPDPHGSPAPPTTEQPAPDGPDDGLHTVDDAGSESTETDAAVPDPAPSDPPETPEPDPTEPVPDANPESPEPHAAPEPAAPEPHVAPEPSPHAAPEPQPAPGPAPQPVPAAPAPQPRPAPITDLFGFFPEPPAPAPRDLVLVPQSQPVANPLAPVLPEIAPRSFWFAIGRLVLAGLCGLLASLLRWASRDLRSSGVLPRVLSVVELLARLAVAVFLLGALAALVPESLAPALPIVVIAAAFAMGWSARDVLHDLVAGVFLLVEGQLRAGSWIRGERYSGTIEAIGVRVTWLRDVYGRRIIVPNRVLLAQPLVADDNPWPRIQFTVAMPTDATTDAIRSALEEAIIVSPWVAPQPDCEVHPDGIQAGHWHIAVRLLDSQYADRFQGLLRERVEEILPR
ncbi:MAG: mechanosensitive ion channel family protein [Alphaproteobacteria bacterium]|nr:mechanosensitive ion channel family protein [Alphaproteobacteria bacterium]